MSPNSKTTRLVASVSQKASSVACPLPTTLIMSKRSSVPSSIVAISHYRMEAGRWSSASRSDLGTHPLAILELLRTRQLPPMASTAMHMAVLLRPLFTRATSLSIRASLSDPRSSPCLRTEGLPKSRHMYVEISYFHLLVTDLL